MRIKLVIQYDGTDFCGWQIQAGDRTVQEEIEKAIMRLTGEKVNLVGSGRTDSGVHAERQTAHFDVSATVPPEKYAAALNPLLPADVKILESAAAEEGFHARFSAKRKTYEYRLYVSETALPLKERYATRVPAPLDVKKMREACAYLLGKHDFKCFLASNSSVKDTVREIYSADMGENGNDISFTVCGNGFLYNMVRIIVGTLVKIGEGKIPPEAMKDIIDGKNRGFAGKTMPAKGLTLKNAEYV